MVRDPFWSVVALVSSICPGRKAGRQTAHSQHQLGEQVLSEDGGQRD